MTKYLIQTEASADGERWHVREPAVPVWLDCGLAEYCDEIVMSAVVYNCALPTGTFIRLLVWGYPETDLTEDTVIYCAVAVTPPRGHKNERQAARLILEDSARWPN